MMRNLSQTCLFGSVFCLNFAYASGFSLYTESNGSAVGNFAAGIAAEAADPSIGWYNPAGLSLQHKTQLLIGGVGVFPSSLLASGQTRYETENFFDPTQPFVYQQMFSNLQGAEDALVPSLHFTYPLGKTTTFGFSLVAPFGLSTNWDSTSAVRYEATYTKLKTIDASPEIGGQINRYFDVGLGLDFQYADVVFNRVIGSPAVMSLLDLPATTLDSQSYNQGDSFGMGFHAGLLLHSENNKTRLGLNYQSAIQHQFQGDSLLTGRLADPDLSLLDPSLANPNATFRSQNLSSNAVSLPSITTLSTYHELNEKVALLGSVVYTNWHTFKSIQLNGVAAAGLNPETFEIAPTIVDASNPENYRNTWRFALGANYKLIDKFMLRIGGGYEQTPTNNIDRDIRLPDSDRLAASIGGHYQFTPALSADIGYTHLFLRHTFVDKIDDIRTSSFHLTASVKDYANLFGAQVVWKID